MNPWKRSLLGVFGALALLAALSHVPGCTVTETGNPKTVMGFRLAPSAMQDEAPQVTRASVSLTAIELRDCASEPAPLASPEAPPETIDLVAGETTASWLGADADVCRCELGQMELSVDFVDRDGEEKQLVLRGDTRLRLQAVEGPYELGPGKHATLAYDLEAWLRGLDLRMLFDGGDALVVDGDADPDALARLTAQLAPHVVLYPDWDQDGMLDDDELQAPHAVGQP